MNFSNTIKLKKVLSLMLVLVMALSLFAGCKKEKPEETDPSENPGLNIDLEDATVPTMPETPAASTEPTEPASENMAKVTSRMNVRAKPAVDAVIVYTLEAGDKIEITRQEYVVGYNWGYTPSVPGGGWIVMDFVEMENGSQTPSLEANQTPAANAGENAPTEETPSTNTNTNTNSNSNSSAGTATNVSGTITATELRIRSDANDTSNILGSYKKGDKVTITETKNGWGKTSKGWISMKYVSTSGSTSTNTNTNTSTSSDATIQSNGSTTVVSKGVVTAGELNIRSKPSSSGEKLGTLKYGSRVEIYETSGGWGRTSKGWISMSYIYKDGTTGRNTDTGTVTGNELHIRSGPGTEYSSVGYYDYGDTVNILEKFTYGNTTWGCTNKGWISLTYVDLEGNGIDDDDDTTSSGRTGWITAKELNIREGAGSSYDEVGIYTKGTRVTILETSGNWGRTDRGWISLSYVDFNNAPDDDIVGNGTVNATELRIRSGSGTGYDVVGSYEYGDRITILDTHNGWGKTNLGWVDMDYVELD